MQELRFAWRMLVKSKGWTAVAVLALALGLGANVAIFSVVGLMLDTPLPYPDPDRLVFVSQTNAHRGFSRAAVGYLETREWGAASGIASIAAFQTRPLAVSGQGEPVHVPAMQVTPEFFSTLGVAPALGRAFTASESPETESRVAIISHELWQGTYQGDAAVLGRDIRLDGRNYSVIGVMPAGFHYLFQPNDVWIPLSLDARQRERAWRGLNTVARLKPGVTLAHASDEIRAISERIARADPKSSEGWRGVVRPLSYRLVDSGARAAAGSMFGGVGFVLLIACANVASLLLARGTVRRRELAVRASLGATRGSLLRLQLLESVLLSVLGGAIGVLSAYWTIPVLKRIAPPDMTFFQIARLDWNALGFGLALSLATGIFFGVVPAWLLTRGDLATAMRDAGRGSTGGRHAILKSLVAGEIALALVLVAATTLMIRNAIRESSVNPGFDKTNLTAGHVLLSTARYPESAQVTDFFSRSLENVRLDGAVESAALVETLPLGGNNSYTGVRVEGQSDGKQNDVAGSMVVSPGYFNTMRIPLLAGRDFTAADKADAPKVAIVNETFVKRYWPKEANPLGRRFRLGSGDQAPWIQVVGMARDVRHTDIHEPPRPELYRPHAQTGSRIMMLVARGRGGANAASGAIRNAVRQADREQPVFRLQSVESLMSNRRAGERATTQVLGILAVIALLLAAVGTYGVMAYTSGQRIREIGIRLALGATQVDVFRMVLREGLLLATIGIAVGLPAAYAVTPLLRAFTTGLEAADPGAFGGVALLLFMVALAACLVPALRAMRIHPAGVLREE